MSLCGCALDADSSTPNPPAVLFEEPQSLSSGDVQVADDESTVAGDTAVRIRYLRIKHHKVECEGFQVSHCFLVQEEGSNEWMYFYDTIDGFNYKWGHNYEILVQTQSIDFGLADTSGQRYALLEVISESKQDINTDFRYISRNSQEWIKEISPGIFSLLGDTAFSCTSQNCYALRSAITQQQHVVLLFQHTEPSDELMMLTAVACSDTASSFAASCLEQGDAALNLVD